MAGYLPCPDVYTKCLRDSTLFFLERATKKNETISAQRAEGRLSPFGRLLLPGVVRWQEIPPLSLNMSLPWPLRGLQPPVVGRGAFPYKSCTGFASCSPSQTRERPARSPPGPCTAAALTELTVRSLAPEGSACQTSPPRSTAGVETCELRKLKPFLSPEKHADPALAGRSRVPGREHSPHPSPATAYLAPAGAHADRPATHAILFPRQRRVGACPVGRPAKLHWTPAHSGRPRLRHHRPPPAPRSPHRPRDRRPRPRRPDHVTAAAAPGALRPCPPQRPRPAPRPQMAGAAPAQ